jgi:hypothetical protein
VSLSAAATASGVWDNDDSRHAKFTAMAVIRFASSTAAGREGMLQLAKKILAKSNNNVAATPQLAEASTEEEVLATTDCEKDLPTPSAFDLFTGKPIAAARAKKPVRYVGATGSTSQKMERVVRAWEGFVVSKKGVPAPKLQEPIIAFPVKRPRTSSASISSVSVYTLFMHLLLFAIISRRPDSAMTADEDVPFDPDLLVSPDEPCRVWDVRQDPVFFFFFFFFLEFTRPKGTEILWEFGSLRQDPVFLHVGLHKVRPTALSAWLTATSCKPPC